MQEIPVKKNEEYIVEINDNGFQGEGIAKIDGFTIIVQNAIKGEKAKIKILKVTSSVAYAKIIEFVEKSKCRVDSDCKTYNRCGGCDLRHIEYNETLKIKRNNVQNCLKKVKLNNIKINECIGMKNPFYYRNKLQYPIGIDKNGKTVMGVFAERTHEIVSTTECKIQNEKSQEIANFIFDFIVKNKIKVYDEKNLKGSIRHIVIRIGMKTNEIMVILVTNTRTIPMEKKLIKELISNYSEIKTIVKNINNKNTNVILGKENEVLFGSGFIYDYLEDLKFKISPMSFYQVNPIQTEILYSTAIKEAKLKGDEIALDLYCGIGTIGLFASRNVKHVYGIEIVEQAIEDAKANAKINNIKNVDFYVGDVEVCLPKLIQEKNIKPDVVFVDPPRKGLDDTTINTLLKLNPNKIIYISCNPATLARDLTKLQEKYEILQVTPVDMFSYTTHTESIAILKLK